MPENTNTPGTPDGPRGPEERDGTPERDGAPEPEPGDLYRPEPDPPPFVGGWVADLSPYLPAVRPESSPVPAPAPGPDAGPPPAADPLAPDSTPAGGTAGGVARPVYPGWWEGPPGGTVVVDDPPDRRREWIIGPRGRAQRRPILPPWARSRAELSHAARWAAGYVSHTVAFHLVRTPLYAARIARYAPAGAGRAGSRFLGWWLDSESAPLRRAARFQRDPDDYMRLSRQRDRRVRARTAVAVPALAAGGTVAGLLAVAGGTVRLLALLLAVVVCGLYGVPEDQPWITRAVVKPKNARLTADIVIRALESLGIAEINRGRGKETVIGFPAPITRDGPGWRADIDLPYGVTVPDIAEKRERLASGLRRPLGAVWPEPAADAHAGRLILWVGDEDLSKRLPPEWPFLRGGQIDLFAAFPFGTDPRGRPVMMSLFENNVLIGSLPGAGKTGAVRTILLAAALDPTAEIWAYNLKGTSDLDCAQHVAGRYATGMEDETVLEVLHMFRDLREEIGRRATVFRRIPRADAPDGKVTRRLANARALGLHPLVVIVDECQNLFSHSLYGKEAGQLAEQIIKLGRALGVILVLATQRPDAASLPTGVSSNASIRFCLRVMGQTENDMILGTSMYKNGVQATTFGPADRGIGYLVGVADNPVIVRGAYLDAIQSDAVALRARATRITAGRLSGYAAGGDVADEPRSIGKPSTLLEDIAAVMTREKEWSDDICEALAEFKPDSYTGWTAEQLTAMLKPHGVATIQIGRRISGKFVNRRGITRADIATAISHRDNPRT